MGAAALGAAAAGLGGVARAQSMPAPEFDTVQEAINPDGSRSWLLSVGPGFQASDLYDVDPNAVLEWHWPEAGIAVASSFSDTFMEDAEGGLANINVDFAVPDLLIPATSPPGSSAAAPSAVNPFDDAYAINVQWYLQAIGAAKPTNAFIAPEWQLGDFEGSGVTIGIVDSGVPAIWPGYNAAKPWGDAGNVAARANARLHPEFRAFDPLHPESGGVVLPDQYWNSSGEPAPNRIVDWDNTHRGDGTLPKPHGTMVASVIGAQHNGVGRMRGIAPKAKLICYKIVNPNNLRFLQLSRVIRAWFLAAGDGVRILNNSIIGHDLPKTLQSQRRYGLLYQKANSELHRNGVLVVACSGNEFLNLDKDPRTNMSAAAMLTLPAEFPNVITVGGTAPRDYDPFGSLSGGDLSVYEPAPGTPQEQKGRAFNLDRFSSFSNYGSAVSVVAPGGEINGALIDPRLMDPPNWFWGGVYVAIPFSGYLVFPYTPYPSPFGLHAFVIGTSFSSPMVCGVAALAAEAYERAYGKKPSATELAVILKKSADDLVGPATDTLFVWNNETQVLDLRADEPCDTPGNDERYRFGRVNAKKAIELAQSLHGP